jgi:phage terminase large subunit-like protein
MIEELDNYCQQVLSGDIPSGCWLKAAVSRFQSDLAKSSENGWVFQEDSVNKVIKFIAKLKHFTGKHAGKHFILQPWQVFIIANLYGFYTTAGSRRFQTAYLEMARKQGKTALVAALALYNLMADGEEAAEVLLAANSKDQAKIAFNMVRAFAKGIDPDELKLKRFRSDILLKNTPAFIKTLAADSSKIDGYNCSVGIIDEYHSAPNSQVRDVIRSSQGMRVNPLLITITTAGFDKSLPCYDLRTVCTEIVSGVKQDDSFFGVIFSLDDDDDWRDPKVWVKSNPNLGITVNTEFLDKQVQQAVNSPADEVGVKTKNLNVWCDSATTWIPDEYIIKASKKLNLLDFKGQDCYIGVDLASNVDLTAVSYLFVSGNKYSYIIDYYIPRDTLKAKVHADLDLYREWVGNKYLKTTSGNVTDYDYITKDLLELSNYCNIRSIFYDKYNATGWAVQCTEQGLPLLPFSQTIGNFNNCTKEFERLILSGCIELDDNPVTRYCLRNVELRMDFNGNVKPLKNSERKKIDGVIASLQALAAYIDATKNFKGINIY